MPVSLMLRTTTVIPGTNNITRIGVGTTAEGFSSGTHNGTLNTTTVHVPKPDAITGAIQGFPHSAAQRLLLTHGETADDSGRVRVVLYYYLLTAPTS